MQALPERLSLRVDAATQTGEADCQTRGAKANGTKAMARFRDTASLRASTRWLCRRVASSRLAPPQRNPLRSASEIAAALRSHREHAAKHCHRETGGRPTASPLLIDRHPQRRRAAALYAPD